jgi:hypothetical protein
MRLASAALLIALPFAALAQDTERGRTLYETHYGACHYERVHQRALYPHIKDCHTAMIHWTDGEGSHYSLRLDVRWPQHQTLVSGEAKDDAAAALAAGFHAARERLREAAWASR